MWVFDHSSCHTAMADNAPGVPPRDYIRDRIDDRGAVSSYPHMHTAHKWQRKGIKDGLKMIQTGRLGFPIRQKATKHRSMTKIAIRVTWPFSRQALRLSISICLADSAMTMHMVLESAEVLHAASGMYRALRTMYIAACG